MFYSNLLTFHFPLLTRSSQQTRQVEPDRAAGLGPIREAEGIAHGTAQGQGLALAVANELDGYFAFLFDRSVFAVGCQDIFILDPVRGNLCLGSGVEIEAAVLGCLFVDIGDGDGDGEVLVEEQATRVGGADADGVGVLVS